MKDIIKILESLEDSSLLLKGVSETIQNEARELKGGYLRLLWAHLVQVYQEIFQQEKE